MNTLDAQKRPTTPDKSARHLLILLLSAFALAACSPPSSDAKVARAERHDSENDESVKGAGHLRITGDVAKDVNFTVDGCSIGKPGEGLLDGYRMHAEDGDSTIAMLSVLLRDYVKDGPYTADTSAAAQLKEGMSSGNFSPLSLMIMADNYPLAFKLTPASSLVITISDNGAKGSAEIKNMESQPGMSEVIAAHNSGGLPHGKAISGSVTWSCGHVDRLNGEMNKAVDGMMDKLMPNH